MIDDNNKPNEGEAVRRKNAYIALAITVLFLLFIFVLSTEGFGPYEATVQGARAPTVWDWLALLIIPLVLALSALWFNAVQKQRELQIAEEARKADHEIAAEARKTEHEIAAERQNQAILEAYYDRMTDLLLNYKLRETKVDAHERNVARARTLAVLRSVDGMRKAQVLEFLAESRLLIPPVPIVSLVDADLTGADLSWLDLAKVDLGGADLKGANLSHADLSSSNLHGANLLQAALDSTNLRGANLEGAILLEVKHWTVEQLEQAVTIEGAKMPDREQMGRYRNQPVHGLSFEKWKEQYIEKYGGTVTDIRNSSPPSLR